MSVEEIIKGRQAIFSNNYRTAKRVDALVKDLEFEDAQKLMIKMSENYKTLLDYFPDNSKEGFNTEALPSIWENKDEFNLLMKQSSEKILKMASIIEDADDLRGEMKKYMWSSCKSCHSKFRVPH
tara:strand:- start:456 stop:830 length:375 start_codon:yes stop_codon:yes gene_type:complete